MAVITRPEPSPAATNSASFALPSGVSTPSASAAQANARAADHPGSRRTLSLTLHAALQLPLLRRACPRFIARPGTRRQPSSHSIPRALSCSRRPSKWPSFSTGSMTIIGTPLLPEMDLWRQASQEALRRTLLRTLSLLPRGMTTEMRALIGLVSVSRAAWAASGGGGQIRTGQHQARPPSLQLPLTRCKCNPIAMIAQAFAHPGRPRYLDGLLDRAEG